MISPTEGPAPRPLAIFPQGGVPAPLLEGSTSRGFDLKDVQVVQALPAAQAQQMDLMLRGHQIGAPISTYAATIAPLPQLAQTAPVLALQNIQAAVTSGLAWAPATGMEGTFSRLGSLLYRRAGLPDLKDLFKPGGLDALLTQKAPDRPELQAQWQAMRLSMQQPSPEAIREAVMAAMGSETNIARVRKPSPLDPKQMLHQILGLLSDSSEEDTEDRQRIKRGIGDLDAAQVAAVQAQNQGDLNFRMVVPFVDAEPVELAFERKQGKNEDTPVYSVSLHSQSTDYGEMWLQADLQGSDQIDLTLWAVRESLVKMAQEGTAALSQNLQDAGLAMRSFRAHHGARPEPAPDLQLHAQPGTVVDLQA